MSRMSERGAAAIELVLLTPVLLLMLLFVVFLGRLGQARNDVDRAARDAARAASIARGPADADEAGRDAAYATLDSGRTPCRQLSVDVDTSGFVAGGTVSARLTCIIDLAQVTGLGVPGTATLSASFREPVDAYRGIRP
jgi:Flp pilus assembly protein TadG